MSFNNSKENVYDFKLTQYGKYLFSKGKLKPAYYAFFDDDILYDGAFANVVENKNSIESRIQEETPYIDCLPNIAGIETNLSTLYNIKEDNTYSENEIYNYDLPLGSSDLYSTNSPSWNFKLLKGRIDSFSSYVTSSNKLIHIPQINTKVIYYLNSTKFEVTPPFEVEGLVEATSLTSDQISLIEGSFAGSEGSEIFNFENKLIEQGNYNNIEIAKIFSDGTAIYSEESSVIVDLQELNTQILDDMFEVEVYKKEFDAESNIVWKQLKFVNEPSIIKNNILIEETNTVELNNEYVEYYFNLFADSEINDQYICDYISPTLSGQNTIVNVVRCKSAAKKQLIKELYTSNLNSGEVCT